MKKFKLLPRIDDTPEHNRFFWAVVIISLLVLFFGCSPAAAHEADDTIKENWWLILAGAWFTAFLYQRKKSTILGFLTLFLFSTWLASYVIMASAWLITHTIP